MQEPLAEFCSTSGDGLDPSLMDGFSALYEREVPIELRSADANDNPSEVGALEAICVKLLVRGTIEQPTAIRVELSSESNLFFHYTHDMDPRSYGELQEGQRLMVEFPEYYTVLLRMLNACIKQPHLQLAVFIMRADGTARLDFIQNMEYKFVELLSCPFEASDDELVRLHITYRYNIVKAKLTLMQSRLVDMNALIKIKAPSLFAQLQRAPR